MQPDTWPPWLRAATAVALGALVSVLWSSTNGHVADIEVRLRAAEVELAVVHANQNNVIVSLADMKAKVDVILVRPPK